MAEKTIHVHTCDNCAADDPDVPAQYSHVMSIDGRSFRRLDFCGPSERAVMGRLLQLYEEAGYEPPELKPEPKEEPPKEAAAQQRPKELEQAPAPQLPTSTGKTKKLEVWCPLKHGPEKLGKLITYKSRVPHARIHGLEIWQIKWKDVHGILEGFCHAHAECMNVNLGFLSAQGVATHIFKVPLPRIDTDAAHEQDADVQPH